MTYDSKLPKNLKTTQQWFASIITRPVDEESRMNPVSPSGNPMKEEANKWIAPNASLTSSQRIEIYNQQHWWRFLNTLQETFPLTLRLFGYLDFNETLAVPFLVKYPSDHWSLNSLGDRFPKWAQEEYHGSDRQLILDAISIDCAYNQSFFAAHDSVFEEGVEADISNLLIKTTRLQPHLYLFQMVYDLFAFRMQFIEKEPDYWLEHDFPEMKRDKLYHFVLWRNGKNQIAYDEVTPGQFALLKRFEKGETLEEACQWLEEQQIEEASQLHLWMQEWILKQWLVFR